MDTPAYIESIMTPAETKAYLSKLRGKTLFISVGQRAPIAGEPDKAFSVIGNVEVTRKQALKFLADAYSETLAARGAMVTIWEYKSCVFIGESA